jgi:hypothetical protein
LKKKVAESETEADESKKKICELEKEVNKLENKLLVPIKEKMSCKIIQENIKKAMIFYYSIDLRKGSISCEKFQAIVKVLIPKDEKNNMLDDINILYDKLFDRIKIRYPELTEQEFKITCMTCISFDNTVIALLLDLDKRIIERSTSEIRKKLKIEYRGDIKTFILENIE